MASPSSRLLSKSVSGGENNVLSSASSSTFKKSAASSMASSLHPNTHLSASFSGVVDGPRKRSFFDFNDFSDDSQSGSDDENEDETSNEEHFDEQAERILDHSLSLVSKVLVMLKSLRPYFPPVEDDASSSKDDLESVTSDVHEAPLLDDPPAKRLEWCIARLVDAGSGAINNNTFAEEQFKRLVQNRLERSNASSVIDDHVMRWLEAAMEPLGRKLSSRQRSRSRPGSRGSLRTGESSRRVSHNRLTLQGGNEGEIGRRLSASLMRMQNIPEAESEPDTSLVHTLRRRRYVTVVPEEVESDTLSDYPEDASQGAVGSRRVSDVQPEYFEHRRRSSRSSLRADTLPAVSEDAAGASDKAQAAVTHLEEELEFDAIVMAQPRTSEKKEDVHDEFPPPPPGHADAVKSPSPDNSADDKKGDGANVAAHGRGSMVFGHAWHSRQTRLTGNTGRVVRLRQASPLNGPPVIKVSHECENYLYKHDLWDINMFELDVVSGYRPLLAMTMHAIQSRNLIERLKLDQHTLVRYITLLENNYGRYPDLLYHNNVHAADVVQATHQLLSVPALTDIFSDVEAFCAIIAAAAHDVGHLGVNNLFLTATQSPLAILYNDQSVLENHHAATCFKLMAREECNIFAPLPTDTRVACRSVIIDMILATDMAKHFKYLAEFRNLLESRRSPAGHTNLHDMNDDEKVLLLQTVVHCADLAGPTRPWEVSKIWAERIVNEFFQQGDKERELNLPLGPLNDRNKIKFPASQIGFIEFIVLPLWETWSEVINEPNCEPIRNMTYNRNMWAALKAEQDRINGQPPSPTPPATSKPGGKTGTRRRSGRHRSSKRHHSHKARAEASAASSMRRAGAEATARPAQRNGSRLSTGSSAGGEDVLTAAAAAASAARAEGVERRQSAAHKSSANPLAVTVTSGENESSSDASLGVPAASSEQRRTSFITSTI